MEKDTERLSITDEDLQEAYDVPFFGLEELTATQLLIVFACWHNGAMPAQFTDGKRLNCQVTSIGSRDGEPDSPESVEYTVIWRDTCWKVSVNENMGVDRVEQVG